MPLSIPLYTLSLPLILTFSFSLTIFAVLTSAVAFSILAIRVLVVYAELAFAVIPYYLTLLIPSTTTATTATSPPAIDQVRDISSLSRSRSFTSSSVIVPSRRRRRPSSTSLGSLTPVASTTSLPLAPSIGAPRDFEGVGGWRQDEDSELWTSINSRLELPAEHSRRHRRSLTSGSVHTSGDRSYSPELLMMGIGSGAGSPNTSRARTPPTTMAMPGLESYFGGGGSPKVSRKAGSSTTFGSGSSGSSKGSTTGLSMKGRI